MSNIILYEQFWTEMSGISKRNIFKVMIVFPRQGLKGIAFE